MTEENRTESPSRPAGAVDRPAREARPEHRPQQRRRPPRRRKFCRFCADKDQAIDHKDPDMLRQFVTERFKIIPARVTGVCAKHQRQLTTAIKRARVLALLPFTTLHHD